MTSIKGHTAPSFATVRQQFQDLWDDIEVGASLTVMLHGETVVDLWGGHADRSCESPWEQDTLVNVYSTSKGIVSMALACLVEDGLLGYGDPVCDYWPEFGAEEKYDITLSALLSHQTGLFQTGLTDAEDLLDWAAVTRQLASARPAWKPGTACGYHAVSWGYLAGEVIRRVTGLTPGTYISERIAAPIEADFHLGLDRSLMDRAAELIGPNHARIEHPRPPRVERELRAIDPMLSPFGHLCTPRFRAAEIPASNGHSNARGLATCYQAFIDGRLVSADVLSDAIRQQAVGDPDLVLGTRVRRANGFILNCEELPMGPGENTFGHSGAGGSIAFADRDNGLVFAYAMNQLHPDGKARYRKLANVTYECLEKLN